MLLTFADFQSKRKEKMPEIYKRRQLDKPRLTKYRAKLEYIYGFKNYGCRKTMKCALGRYLVYPAGNVMVVYDIVREYQRHFLEHETNIHCFDLYEEKVRRH